MIIALTGGIGSGKSIVSKIFEVMGCVIYDSDEKAKALYLDDVVKKQVINLFGQNAYLPNHKLNTAFISDIVFKDKIKLEKLNAIIHPALVVDFDHFVTRQESQSIIIKESALIFETNLYQNFKHIILVVAPLEQKIDRVMKRNAISKIEIEKRMSLQWTDEKKQSLSNYIIVNDYSKPLIPQVINILNLLKTEC
jgi:dephospho-CoA kinase